MDANDHILWKWDMLPGPAPDGRCATWGKHRLTVAPIPMFFSRQTNDQITVTLTDQHALIKTGRGIGGHVRSQTVTFL